MPGPVANDDFLATDEDTLINGSLFADNGAGADQNAVTVTAVNGQAADVGEWILLASGARIMVNADGSYVYVPVGRQDYLGSGDTAVDVITYEVSDGLGGTDTATATITSDGVNDAPVVRYTSPDSDPRYGLFVSFDDPVTGNLLGGSTDAEGDALTVVSINGQPVVYGEPIPLTSDYATGGLYITIHENGAFVLELRDEPGIPQTNGEIAGAHFTYVVSDGNGGIGTNSIQVSFSNLNTPPDLSVEDVVLAPDEWIQLSEVLDYWDYNGQSLAGLTLYDTEGDLNFWYAGRFVRSGTELWNVDPEDIWIQADDVEGVSQLGVRVTDGTVLPAWSAFSDTVYFSLTTAAPGTEIPGWVFGWHVDPAGWYSKHGLVIDWDYGWRIDWSFGWHVDWAYGWHVDWAWGWHIDWAWGWHVDWSYGWHYDWSWAWAWAGGGWVVDWSWNWDNGWWWRWDFGWDWSWDYGSSWRWDHGWSWSWGWGWSWAGWTWSWAPYDGWVFIYYDDAHWDYGWYYGWTTV
ncbi:MAG: Ig-like domain-containing protein [Paracoccaceae bacterium]